MGFIQQKEINSHHLKQSTKFVFGGKTCVKQNLIHRSYVPVYPTKTFNVNTHQILILMPTFEVSYWASLIGWRYTFFTRKQTVDSNWKIGVTCIDLSSINHRKYAQLGTNGENTASRLNITNKCKSEPSLFVSWCAISVNIIIITTNKLLVHILICHLQVIVKCNQFFCCLLYLNDTVGDVVCADY